MISLMSFVGLHVSASDEIFSELEMLIERHATDESCGGDVIFFRRLVKCSKKTSISRMEDCLGRNVVISHC